MTLEEAKKTGKNFKVVPVSKEIAEGEKTPMEVLRKLKKVSTQCYLLESVEKQKKRGRYTFLGFEPEAEVTCMDGKVVIQKKETETIKNTIHPKEVIQKILEEYKSPKIEGYPPFTGGFVGYFSYDYAKYSEPSLHLSKAGNEEFQDMDLMLFNKVIAFDHVRKKIIVIVNVKTEKIEEEYARAIKEIDRIIDLIENGIPLEHIKGSLESEYRTLFSKEAYCDMVYKYLLFVCTKVS